jgi:hypothetical protein
MSKVTFLICLMVLLTQATKVAAQEKEREKEKEIYYLDFNTSQEKNIHDITNLTLGLQYRDAYGKWEDMLVEIYSWRRELVATLALDKAFGMNTYKINLKDVYDGWKTGDLYFCRFKDEAGKKYGLAFRIVAPPEFPSPVVNILVNPLRPECDEGPEVSSVEFLADIKGGMAPYNLKWYVLNDSRTDFLYQPREEKLKTSGKSSSITVNTDPSYYVVLYVEDNCGNVEQRAVNLVCQNSRKKINTIFAEKVTLPYLAKPTK